MIKSQKNKVKRWRIILSAVLTMIIGVLCLGVGSYLGYVTLNINYLTIGTMTSAVGGLLVVAGFFIFFGCVGGVIALKEFFISSRNEEKFSVYKPALISAVVYYCVIALISLVGIIMAFASYLPATFVWTIIGLSVVSLLLCVGTFICVFKELKEHKKAFNTNKQSENDKTGNKGQNEACRKDGYSFANMQLTVDEIHKFLQSKKINSEEEKKDPFKKEDENKKKEVDLYGLAEKLMQLEELRNAGLINEQEYKLLKRSFITVDS